MKNLVTTKELCEKYKISKQGVAKWRNTGLPFYQFGYRSIRYDESEVEQYLKKKRSQRAE